MRQVEQLDLLGGQHSQRQQQPKDWYRNGNVGATQSLTANLLKSKLSGPVVV